MSDLADVEICRLQEEVRCLRAEIERLKADVALWQDRYKHRSEGDAQKIEQLKAALKGMLDEWEKLARYGSPMAKAANERVNAARRALEEK
jgi:hypothetical protein